jgi:transglutaminase-like putative cysteine protease
VSRLVANESGRVVATLGAEVDGRRHLRTHLELDGGRTRLYILARAHSADGPPLRVSLDGEQVGQYTPTVSPVLTWHSLEIEGPGNATKSEVVLSSTGDDMSAWSVAVDHSPPGGDELSTDGGASWQSDRIGYLQLAAGRYVLRARIDRGEDPPPPEHIWEHVGDPHVEAFRKQLPTAATSESSSWAVARALSTWICESWEYRNSTSAHQYAPWDPAVVLAWGKRGSGHAGSAPVVMCVHYAVTLAAACQALGIPARCAAITGSINGFDGHFVTEVWIAELGRWVMIDPTYDVWVGSADAPLGLHAIHELGPDVGPMIAAGPGIESRLATREGKRWFEENLRQGVCFKNLSRWPRSDFISHPGASPAGHGATSYSELELVWERGATSTDLGMFRYFADTERFERKPEIADEGAEG